MTGPNAASRDCCAVTACLRSIEARGWCHTHYTRWRRTGDPGPAKIRSHQPRDPTCTITGCTQPHRAQGLCNAHYQRWQRTGTTTPKTPTRRTRNKHARAQITALTTTDDPKVTDAYTTESHTEHQS